MDNQISNDYKKKYLKYKNKYLQLKNNLIGSSAKYPEKSKSAVSTKFAKKDKYFTGTLKNLSEWNDDYDDWSNETITLLVRNNYWDSEGIGKKIILKKNKNYDSSEYPFSDKNNSDIAFKTNAFIEESYLKKFVVQPEANLNTSQANLEAESLLHAFEPSKEIKVKLKDDGGINSFVDKNDRHLFWNKNGTGKEINVFIQDEEITDTTKGYNFEIYEFEDYEKDKLKKLIKEN